MIITKIPDTLVHHYGQDRYFGKFPETLLIMDFDGTLMDKGKFQFKYDIAGITADKYKLIIVTNQSSYKPGNKTYDTLNKKLFYLNSITCNYEVYIAAGSVYYHRKPSSFIGEQIIKKIAESEEKRISEKFPKFSDGTDFTEKDNPIRDLIKNGQIIDGEDFTDKFIKKEPHFWEGSGKNWGEFIYTKIFPYKNIIYVGDQAGRKSDLGTDDINFARNFNLMMPYLENKYKYYLPRVNFMSPEAFFYDKKKYEVTDPNFLPHDLALYNKPELDPYEYFNYFIQNPNEYYERPLPAKSKSPEILYNCGFPCSGKSTLAKYISKKWNYILINREPVNSEFIKEITAQKLEKSYVLDLNVIDFKYSMMHHTRAFVIKTDLPRESRAELYKHLILAKTYHHFRQSTKIKGIREVVNGNKVGGKSLEELKNQVKAELDRVYDPMIPQFTVAYFPSELLLDFSAEEKKLKAKHFKLTEYYRLHFMQFK